MGMRVGGCGLGYGKKPGLGDCIPVFSVARGPICKSARGGFSSGGSRLNYSFQEVAFVSFDHTESGKGQVRINGMRGRDKGATYFRFSIFCHVP